MEGTKRSVQRLQQPLQRVSVAERLERERLGNMFRSSLVETKEGENSKRGCGEMPLFGCGSERKGKSTVLDEKRDDGLGEMAVSTSDRFEKTDDGGRRGFVSKDEEKEVREGVPVGQRGDEVFEERPERVFDIV